ncbi:type II toxin-antitoxin system YafQ family toxin [Pedobacter sp. SD-b]|uniref:Type II toxin-antitoxin system YafQ family toxin n=1 Tax=Pedobacter segetis TaxID=2793069 RepID=A0ABS1BNX8_9SPHI|nr:type II toxin-antitoxin system YafQ family toxin [Pedobacter segetis]
MITKFLKNLTIDGVLGIDKRFKAHKLSGNYKDNWEAHIKPDLLIIWLEIKDNNEINLIRTGSHSELF